MSSSINIWDKMARSFHALSSRSKAHKDKYLTIAKMIMEANPKSVIDLGCGSGLLESELIKLGYKGNITAIDGSIEMLKLAKSLCGDRVNFIQADLEMPLNIDEQFELAVSINVLFFLQNKYRFLKNVNKILVDSESIFILVNPKPKKYSNNWQFVKAHFAKTTLKEKLLISLNEITNIPRYLKMINGQSKLDKMAKKGQIIVEEKDDIILLAKDSKFEIKNIEDIHANQNWMFLLRAIK